MRKIIQIVGKEPRVSKAGKDYVRTHAVLDDGTECVGWGADFAVGDLVEVFYHKETCKMRKPVDKPLT